MERLQLQIFFQILSLNNIPVASIGTLGIKYKNKHIKTGLTSHDKFRFINIYRCLRKTILIMLLLRHRKLARSNETT